MAKGLLLGILVDTIQRGFLPWVPALPCITRVLQGVTLACLVRQWVLQEVVPPRPRFGPPTHEWHTVSFPQLPCLQRYRYL